MSIFIIFIFIVKSSSIIYGIEKLTLKDAIEIAIKESPLLKSEDSAVKESKGKISQAKSNLFPKVNIREIYTGSNNPVTVFSNKLNQESFGKRDFGLDRLNYPNYFNNFNTSFSMDYSIYNGGRDKHYIKLAKINSSSIEKERERRKEKLIFRVIKSFNDIVIAKEKLKVAEESLKISREHLNLANNLYKEGFALKSDILLAEVHLSEVKEMLIKAKNELKFKKALLNKEMGIDQNREFFIENPSVFLEENYNINKMVSYALNNRHDLLSIKERIKAIEESINIAKSDYLPDIDLRIQYDLNDKNLLGSKGNSWTVVGLLKINIFDGFLTRSAVREKRETLKRFISLKKDMENSIELEVRRSILGIRDARERIKVTNTAIKKAKEGMRIIEKRYKAGLAKMIELLDSEVALSRAKFNSIEALYDYQIRRAQLYISIGNIKRFYKEG
jgi:outer membrane protein TolC